MATRSGPVDSNLVSRNVKLSHRIQVPQGPRRSSRQRPCSRFEAQQTQGPDRQRQGAARHCPRAHDRDRLIWGRCSGTLQRLRSEWQPLSCVSPGYAELSVEGSIGEESEQRCGYELCDV